MRLLRDVMALGIEGMGGQRQSAAAWRRAGEG